MAKDNSLRFYLNPEIQKDLVIILLDMEARMVPGITNSTGRLIQSAALQEFIRREKAAMQKARTPTDATKSLWDYYKEAAESRGLI